MGCCGGGTQTGRNAARQASAPVVTGYAIDMPDGRVFTYLTLTEAQEQHERFALETPIREVLGYN